MFKNYLKIVLRGLLKNKSYSLLNILGLAVGITFAALIFLWVEDELNYDTVFPNREYLYNVPTNQDYNGDIYTFNSTPGQLAPTLKSDIPGIAATSRFNTENHLLTSGDKSIYKTGAYVDPDFYSMFSVKFLEGSMENVNSHVNGIVLTLKMAEQYFGSFRNIVGKTLKIDNDKVVEITAVIADLPSNVTLKYDWLRSFEAYEQGREYLKMWGNNSTSTLVQLSPQADVEAVNSAVKKVIPEHSDNQGRIYGFLNSMKDWHLRNKFDNGIRGDGAIIYVRLFAIIALIILVIACINFMNLSTARSEKRAGEVGVRKVLGSNKKNLILQFFSEAIVLTFLSALVSLLFIALLLPFFNEMIGKDLQMHILQPVHLLALLAIICICSLLSGLYPAFYLSSFRPAVILKGLRSSKKGTLLVRNSLVVVQFAASIILIISTIIVYLQIKHVKSRDVGFDKNNLVAIDIRGDLGAKMDRVRQEMLNTGLIADVGLNSYNVLNGGYNGSGYDWEGKAEEFDPLLSFRSIDSHFIPTVGMQLIDGRNFSDTPDTLNTQVIITQSLATMMGKSSAVGKVLRRDNRYYEIIGVVKNYLYGDMYKKSDPVLFFNNPAQAGLIYVRIKPEVSTDKAISALSAIVRKNNPAFPFEYHFVDQTFNAKFKNEVMVENLSLWFALLAISISCFGLFGLSAYTAEQRSKEIGVRRVLGASISSIVNMLSLDFLKLVLVSVLIATPVAWYVMSGWLEEFGYRISLQWWMFSIAAILALLIALFTVSFQALKAATANPTNSLKTE